jgi:hypothetical protein
LKNRTWFQFYHFFKNQKNLWFEVLHKHKELANKLLVQSDQQKGPWCCLVGSMVAEIWCQRSARVVTRAADSRADLPGKEVYPLGTL